MARSNRAKDPSPSVSRCSMPAPPDVAPARSSNGPAAAPAAPSIDCSDPPSRVVPTAMPTSVEDESRLGQQLFLAGRRERDRQAAGRCGRRVRLPVFLRENGLLRTRRSAVVREENGREDAGGGGGRDERADSAAPAAGGVAVGGEGGSAVAHAGQLADVPRMRRRRRPGVHRPGGSTAPPVGPPTPHLRAGRLAKVIRLAKASLRPCAIPPSLGRMRTLAGTRCRRLPAGRTGGTVLVGSYENLAGDETPAAPRWTNGEPGRGFRAAAWRRVPGTAAWRPSPAEPGGAFLVPFYRDLRGTSLKGRIDGTSSARQVDASGQTPTSP